MGHATLFDEHVKKIRRSLLKLAPDLLGRHPVLFSYLYGSYATGLVHPFSDLDIGIYAEKISRRQCLKLEMSLALEIDKGLEHVVASEVRVMNDLPLVVTGNIITEGILIFSKNEVMRVDFETSIRSAYFDFLPVLHAYQNAYMENIAS